MHRREGFRKAFADFDPVKVARFTEKKMASLMQDESIIRNRLKIVGTVKNAKAFLAVQKEFGSFDAYIWQFVEGKPVVNQIDASSKIPASTPLSDRVSKDMKKRGFTFVGTTICYAYLQAAGLVNDHLVNCFYRKK